MLVSQRLLGLRRLRGAICGEAWGTRFCPGALQLGAPKEIAYLSDMRFWFKKSRSVAFSAPLAPAEPLCVIGDVHGCAKALCQLLDQVLHDPLQPRLICVGDYIDRGEQSAEVLGILQKMQAEHGDRLICLMGNHERMLLDFLEAPERAGRRWLQFGGLQTLASYRLLPVSETAPAADWQALRDRLRETMGAQTEAWLNALPLSWRSGNVGIVHAAADPDLPFEAQPEEVLLWGHKQFATKPRSDGLWVVHGHTIVEEAMAQQGRISIDTGAYATGRLTAALVTQEGLSYLAA